MFLLVLYHGRALLVLTHSQAWFAERLELFCHGAPSRWDRPFLSRSACVMRNVVLLECFERFVTGARASF